VVKKLGELTPFIKSFLESFNRSVRGFYHEALLPLREKLDEESAAKGRLGQFLIKKRL
jgi:hypothetical protein